MATQKRSLASMKAVYAPQNETTNNTGGNFTNNYYPFWNMKVGERAIIRFLPDANSDNPRGFLVEKVVHNLEINGQRRTIPCLSMYGEDCPICKVSQAYYKVNDKINGKKYWKNKQHIAQVLVVEDPLPLDEESGEKHTGKIRYINLGFQIFNIIKEAMASDELEDWPDDYENGYDFIIKKTDQGGYASYAVGTKFANKPRSLSEDELSIVHDGLIDLSTLLPKNPGEDKVQAMLDAEMNGEEYKDDSSSTRASAPATPTPKQTESKPKATPAPSTDDDDEDEGEDPDVDEMLAKIRSRRQAKA